VTVTPAKMRIGEVHTLLRSEFPTIELSKIRYYEDKGLVRPSRSRKGYRLYSANDVDCLREAFRLAQEEFVPLRVVRQRLIEQGLLADEPLAPATRQAAKDAASNIVTLPVRHAPRSESSNEVEPDTNVDARSTAMSIVADFDDTSLVGESSVSPLGAKFATDEFLATTKLTDQSLRDCIFYGFLAPRVVAGVSYFDECDAAVATRIRALVDRGVDVRHLQPIKRTVERQVDLLDSLTAPLRQLGGDRGGVDVVGETRDVAHELAALRSILVDRATKEYFGQ
jgi:DNA-binding transcriptional MerR regulator